MIIYMNNYLTVYARKIIYILIICFCTIQENVYKNSSQIMRKLGKIYAKFELNLG